MLENVSKTLVLKVPPRWSLPWLEPERKLYSFAETQKKTFRNTLNVTAMNVTNFYMNFSFVLYKMTPLPFSFPTYGPVRVFLK